MGSSSLKRVGPVFLGHTRDALAERRPPTILAARSDVHWAQWSARAACNAGSVCVIDPGSTFLEEWRRRFAMLGIAQLRSPAFAHPAAFDPAALTDFAVKRHRAHRSTLPRHTTPPLSASSKAQGSSPLRPLFSGAQYCTPSALQVERGRTAELLDPPAFTQRLAAGELQQPLMHAQPTTVLAPLVVRCPCR